MGDGSMELVVPAVGEIVNLEDAASCAQALSDVRSLESQLREAKGVLTEHLIRHSMSAGTKTLHLGSLTAEVKGGTETLYDAEPIEAGLREAGAPEALIREVVVETVTYKVDGQRAKRAAAANPAYAEVIDQHRRVQEKPAYVSIRR